MYPKWNDSTLKLISSPNGKICMSCCGSGDDKLCDLTNYTLVLSGFGPPYTGLNGTHILSDQPIQDNNIYCNAGILSDMGGAGNQYCGFVTVDSGYQIYLAFMNESVCGGGLGDYCISIVIVDDAACKIYYTPSIYSAKHGPYSGTSGICADETYLGVTAEWFPGIFPAWQIGVIYDINDGVYSNGGHYVCKVHHTASPSNCPETGASWSTYWDAASCPNLQIE